MERYDDNWDPTGRKARQSMRELGYQYVDIKCDDLDLFPEHAVDCLEVGVKCKWEILCIDEKLQALSQEVSKQSDTPFDYYGSPEIEEREIKIFEKCRDQTAHLAGIKLPSGIGKRQAEWNACINDHPR